MVSLMPYMEDAMSLTEQEKQLIENSITRVSEIVGDPTPQVYERLFSLQPEMKPLFILDTDDGAKGHMLSEALGCILDFLGPRTYAPVLIQSELTNHEGFGIPPAVFTTFFEVVKDTFSDMLKEEWDAGTDAAWVKLLDEFSGLINEQVSRSGMVVA